LALGKVSDGGAFPMIARIIILFAENASALALDRRL
jgi:hypothetical protein